MRTRDRFAHLAFPRTSSLAAALAAVAFASTGCSGATDGREGAGGSPAGSGGSAMSGAGGGDLGGASGGPTGTGGDVETGGGSAGTGGATGSGGSQGTGGSGAAGGPGSGRVYVYASGYGGAIATLAFDPEAGSLTPKGQLPGVRAPSFLAWNSPGSRLYALNEVGDAGRVQAFSVNPSDGSLRSINDADSGGGGPAHVLADPTGNWVFAANYDGGTASVLPVMPDGGLGAPVDTQSFGPDSWPHEVVLDPSHRFAFVVLKGASEIAQFDFDRGSGKLMPNSPARVQTADGVGPRHLAFRPDAKFAYVITEQGSTIIAYAYDASKGTLSEIQTESTRAAGASGDFNITAEIAVHPSGKWVYGSNRGDDNIVQFSLGDADGKMTLVGHTDSGGQTPRHFSFAPDGRFMFVANEDSDNIVLFRIETDGKLAPAGDPVQVSGLMPTFVGALQMP